MTTSVSTTSKQLEPGRELDKIIAVQLMGYERFECEFIAAPMWRSPDGTEYAESEAFFNLIAFSTDILCAWQIVERYMVLNFHDPGGFMLVYDQNEDEWNCSFHTDWPSEHLCAYAKTAPLAIYLAALATEV